MEISIRYVKASKSRENGGKVTESTVLGSADTTQQLGQRGACVVYRHRAERMKQLSEGRTHQAVISSNIQISLSKFGKGQMLCTAVQRKEQKQAAVQQLSTHSDGHMKLPSVVTHPGLHHSFGEAAFAL